MDHIVLVQIESLHARVVEEAGLKLRIKRREVATGTIVAHLDEKAEPPANLGLINLTTGAIQLQWAIIATLPLAADAAASGQVSPKENGLLRVSFDEAGRLLEDGSGFDAAGGASVASGSFLSAIKVAAHSNWGRLVPGEPAMNRALASGKSVRCALVPESYLDLKIPTSFGGGAQRVHLMGAFVLAPLMSLGSRERAKRTR